MNKIFAFFFELLFVEVIYIEVLYENSVYETLGFGLIFITFLICLLFYKIIDAVRFSNRLYWLLFLLINITIHFFIGYYITYRLIGFDFYSINIGVKNAIVSIPIFLIFSFIFRYFSTNNRHNPF